MDCTICPTKLAERSRLRQPDLRVKAVESRRKLRRRRCVRPQILGACDLWVAGAVTWGRFRPSRCRTVSVRLTLGVAGQEIAVRPDNGLGRTSRWRACGCATASGAPMPIRAPWTWLGETSHFGLPQSAPERLRPDSPILPAAAGSLPASSPVREGKTANRDGCVPVLGRRYRPTHRPAGRPKGPPPPRSGARHPSRTGLLLR